MPNLLETLMRRNPFLRPGEFNQPPQPNGGPLAVPMDRRPASIGAPPMQPPLGGFGARIGAGPQPFDPSSVQLNEIYPENLFPTAPLKDASEVWPVVDPAMVAESQAPTAPAAPAASSAPLPGELPYQTYERVTGQRWTGGRSNTIRKMLEALGIQDEAGSAKANMALQAALNAGKLQR